MTCAACHAAKVHSVSGARGNFEAFTESGAPLRKASKLMTGALSIREKIWSRSKFSISSSEGRWEGATRLHFGNRKYSPSPRWKPELSRDASSSKL